jgi:hypothetical protein
MKMIVYTQVHENYAAHDGFDGRYYWKAKGGREIEVAQFDAISSNNHDYLNKLIDAAQEKFAYKSDYFMERVISWDIIDDNDLTPNEIVQRDYCTEISDPREINHLNIV